MHTSECEHIRRVKREKIPLLLLLYTVCSSIFFTARVLQVILSSLLALSGMYGPHHASLPVPLGRIATTLGSHGELPSHATCMRCMHQKTDYACYARTQLQKRLHTMHTETRIGVSVGLRARKCMHLRMHTDCIQVHTSEHKHIRRIKEGNSSSYFFFILSVFYLLLSAISGIHLLLPASSDIHGPHHASLLVLLGRIATTLGGR